MSVAGLAVGDLALVLAVLLMVAWFVAWPPLGGGVAFAGVVAGVVARVRGTGQMILTMPMLFRLRMQSQGEIVAASNDASWYVKAGKAICYIFLVILLTCFFRLLQYLVESAFGIPEIGLNTPIGEFILIDFATSSVWGSLCYCGSAVVGLKRWRFFMCGYFLFPITFACIVIYPWIKSESTETKYNYNGLLFARIAAILIVAGLVIHAFLYHKTGGYQ